MNRLHRVVASIKASPFVPKALQPSVLSLVFNTQVKMALTCGLQVQELTTHEARVALPNRVRVQNHLGGVHACGMALLAESATGMVFGMNVPDSAIPVVKSMTIRYKKRAKGGLQAVATLSPEQIEAITTQDKGEVLVPVQVTDESGAQPIECDMLWAWVPKQRK